MFEEIPINCRYGYIRVSSESQEGNSSLESQKEELIKLEVREKNIRLEVGSATDKIEDRPIFYDLIDNELKENNLLKKYYESKDTNNLFQLKGYSSDRSRLR